VANRAEWREQTALASLLGRWLPDDAFFTATDPIAPSARSGALRRARGVAPGVPDMLVWYRGKSIAIELKAPGGRCTPSQLATREALIKARVTWWLCLSARSALVALRRSNVKFRTVVREDGATVTWRAPRLPGWERPRRDPRERRPQHPQVAAERREAARRRREQKRAGVLEARDDGAQPPAGEAA
jgi:hypothetical protein